MKISIIIPLGLLCLIATLSPISCQAEDQAFYNIYGSEEELSEDDLLKIESMLSNPLKINSASRSELMDSGLFTAYQTASIIDYRERMGEILSPAEFALIDGIGEYMSNNLAQFLSFSPSGASDKSLRPKGTATLKGQWKEGSTAWASRVVYTSGYASFAIAARSTYSDKKIFPPSTVAYYGSWAKGGTKLVAGDMNLRFGQGLALWSGMSLSGITSPLSLYKRGGGISGTSAYSGTSHRGLAAMFSLGNLVFTPFVSFPGARDWLLDSKKKISVLPGGNASLFLPWGQIGITGWYYKEKEAGAISIDGRACLKGIDIFADAAWEPASKAIAGLLGAVFPVADRSRIGFQVRCYPKSFQGLFAGAIRSWSKTSDEAGASVSFGSGMLSVAADFAKRLSQDNQQIKLSISDVIKLSGRLELKVRAIGRLRNYGNERQRVDLRSDICYSITGIKINGRMNWVHSVGNGILSYLESAFGDGKKSILWLRATVFSAEKWADRLYSYERDAPGSFLIPAYYGHGYALSAYMTRKFSLHGYQSLAFYLRASYTGYWRRTKPKVMELRLCLNYNF